MSHIKKGAQKHPKQRLGGGCAMGAYLALTCTYLVSNSTYYCKLSFNGVPTGEDHCDICLAGVWLHKERFLRTSSIVIFSAVGTSLTSKYWLVEQWRVISIKCYRSLTSKNSALCDMTIVFYMSSMVLWDFPVAILPLASECISVSF